MKTLRTKTVAKTKPDDEAKGKPNEEISVVHLRGTAEFRDWLLARMKETYIPISTLTRLAFKSLAKERGWPDPPDR